MRFDHDIAIPPCVDFWEKENMWTTMGKLSEYNEFASALDTAVEEKIAELRAREKPRKQTCSSPTRCSGSGSVARTS